MCEKCNRTRVPVARHGATGANPLHTDDQLTLMHNNIWPDIIRSVRPQNRDEARVLIARVVQRYIQDVDVTVCFRSERQPLIATVHLSTWQNPFNVFQYAETNA